MCEKYYRHSRTTVERLCIIYKYKRIYYIIIHSSYKTTCTHLHVSNLPCAYMYTRGRARWLWYFLYWTVKNWRETMPGETVPFALWFFVLILSKYPLWRTSAVVTAGVSISSYTILFFSFRLVRANSKSS